MKWPVDFDEADWANCGPMSLAAILNRHVENVRNHLGDFEKRHYMNPTHMKTALESSGNHGVSIGPNRPRHGLVFVQWGGHEKKPVAVQYRFTHWIAVDGDTVFECNADNELVTWDLWQRVMPRLMQEEKSGDGTYFIRCGIEVPRDAY